MKTKVCKTCKINKPLTEFYQQNKKRKNGEEYIYYNPNCKECCILKSLEWNYSNIEAHHKNYNKYYNSNTNIKQKQREKSKKARESGYYKKWQNKNKEKISHYNIKRQEFKMHDITKEEWQECLEYFDYKCAYCGMTVKESKNIYGKTLHKEHVDHNGSNKIYNCVPSCQSCNSSKYTFNFEEWYREQDFYDEDKLVKIKKWISDSIK